MTMDEVRKTHGAPARDLGAVGSPAITRWVYDGFTVYFEGRRVVHTVRTQPLSAGAAAPAVVTQPAAAPAAPAPAAAPVVISRPAEPVVAAPAPAAPVVAAPEPAAATPVVVAPAPAPAAPVAAAPAPAAAPPAPVVVEKPSVTPPAAAPAPAGSGFRFDPATGRLIIDSDQAVEAEPQAPAAAVETRAAEATTQQAVEAEDAPKVIAPFESEEPAPAPEAASPEAESSPLDDTLEFDPETGTFRPKQ